MTQTVIVTGANRGIGLAFCKAYLAQGAHVFGLCRTSSVELDACGAQVIDGVDVADAKSIASLFSTLQELQCTQIDVLINNAGILHSDVLGEFDYDQIEGQMLVNAIGPLRITEALMPLLKKGAKIALITSRMGSIADNSSGAYYGYRMSKAALNAAAKSLAIDLKPSGIAVAILHPGFVQTDMVNNAGDISAETAVKRLVERVDALTLATTGTFWHSNGEVLPW